MFQTARTASSRMRALRRPLLETGWSSHQRQRLAPKLVQLRGRGGFADQAQNGKGFIYFAIAPVNAGDVPAATVAAQQDNPAGQRAFEDGQDVVAVEPEFISVKLAGFDAEFLAALNVFVSAGVAGDGHALAAGEVVPVAHQFDGGARGVAAVEQPAEVGSGGAQRGELPGDKEPLVPRSEAPVCLMPCHGGN